MESYIRIYRTREKIKRVKVKGDYEFVDKEMYFARFVGEMGYSQVVGVVVIDEVVKRKKFVPMSSILWIEFED